jgi:hypothetical protein
MLSMHCYHKFSATIYFDNKQCNLINSCIVYGYYTNHNIYNNEPFNLFKNNKLSEIETEEGKTRRRSIKQSK